MALRLVQLTDLHLLADAEGAMLGIPLRESLRHVVAAAQQAHPDLVLVTGDLSQDGSAASYEAARKLLAPLSAPCYALPGNHDVRPALEEVLTQSPFRPNRAFTAGGWRLLLLDSAVPGAVHGQLAATTLEALDAELTAHPDHPTLIALHHAPVPVGAAWLDPLNLHDPEDFRQVVKRHPQVRLVLFGHVHQTAEAQWGDTGLYGCPSTGFQFAPQAETFAIDAVPPGYRCVTLHLDGAFETTLHRVPVPFTPDPDAAGY